MYGGINIFIKYKIIILSLLLTLSAVGYARAGSMGGQGGLLGEGGSNIGGMLGHLGVPLLMANTISSPLGPGNVITGPLGLGILSMSNAPIAQVIGSGSLAVMDNIIHGQTAGPTIMNSITSPLGYGTSGLGGFGGISMLGTPGIGSIMTLGLTAPGFINPLGIGVSPMSPSFMGPLMTGLGPIAPGFMNPFMIPGAMIPTIMSPLMNPGLMMPSMMNPLMMNPAPMMPSYMNPWMMGGHNPMIPSSISPPAIGFPEIPFLYDFNPINNQGPEPVVLNNLDSDPMNQQSEDCRLNSRYLGLVIFTRRDGITIKAKGIWDDCNKKMLLGHAEGGVLPGGQTPDYRWWYGCSPTSAGMMMAYFDLYGWFYNGLAYDLIPGGIAPLETFSFPDPLYPNGPISICNIAIASAEHILDFWNFPSDPLASFGLTGDPLALGRDSLQFNCLADFMGTSQDGLTPQGDGNPDGITQFWFYADGSVLSSNPAYYPTWFEPNYSGMVGLVEWAEYCGYLNAYATNQYLTGYLGNTIGFDFYAYIRHIGSGRPVILHLADWALDAGHTVLGYGYNDLTQEALIHDVWSPEPHIIPWTNEAFTYSDPAGNIYNFELYGVTTFQPDAW